MCHSDGKSPYYKSEVPYNPETWGEWTKDIGITADSTGLTFVSSEVGYYRGARISNIIKASTKYGILFTLLENSCDNSSGIYVGGGASVPFNGIVLVNNTTSLGNKAHISTTLASVVSPSNFGLYISPSNTIGTGAKN